MYILANGRLITRDGAVPYLPDGGVAVEGAKIVAVGSTAELKAQYPDLSLGTVYRNLTHLCERGLIQRVGAVDGQERYDGVVTPHSHFICSRCGVIIDLPEQSPGREWLDTAGVQYGFQAEGCEFIVRGTCRDCVDVQADAEP